MAFKLPPVSLQIQQAFIFVPICQGAIYRDCDRMDYCSIITPRDGCFLQLSRYSHSGGERRGAPIRSFLPPS